MTLKRTTFWVAIAKWKLHQNSLNYILSLQADNIFKTKKNQTSLGQLLEVWQHFQNRQISAVSDSNFRADCIFTYSYTYIHKQRLDADECTVHYVRWLQYYRAVQGKNALQMQDTSVMYKEFLPTTRISVTNYIGPTMISEATYIGPQ